MIEDTVEDTEKDEDRDPDDRDDCDDEVTPSWLRQQYDLEAQGLASYRGQFHPELYDEHGKLKSGLPGR